MPVLLKEEVSTDSINTVIDRSIQEMYNPLVNVEENVKETARQEAGTFADPIINFIKFHLDNKRSHDDDYYSSKIVATFYDFMRAVENALKRNSGSRYTSLSILMISMSLFRQIQRDAEELGDSEMLIALNRLELDFLKMHTSFFKAQNQKN